MTDKFNTYIHKSGESISLSPAEREKMRGVIREYIAMKPLRITVHEESAKIPFWHFYFRPLAAALVFAVFASSGISYAARGALPGDLLYAVKTNVNEPLKEALTLSSEAKQELAMDISGERLKEAATLAARGELDESAEMELRANFEQHAFKASDTIRQQSETNPALGAEAAVRFEARLSEYERVLSEVAEAKGVKTGTLASSVQTERARVSSILERAQSRAQVGTSEAKAVAAARMRDAAKKGLSESKKLSDEAHAAFASSSAETIARNLEYASATIAAGENMLGNDEGRKALGAFQNALADTEKMNVLLETSSRIHKRTGLLITEPKKNGVGNGKGSKNQQFSERAKERSSDTFLTASLPVSEENDDGTLSASEAERVEDSSSLPLVVPIPASSSSVSI